MRAFTGWGAILLLLVLTFSKRTSYGNVSEWNRMGAYPDRGKSLWTSLSKTGLCGLGKVERSVCIPPVDASTCSTSGVCSDCREHGEQRTEPDERTRKLNLEEADDANAEDVGRVRAVGEVADEYIVRFKEYQYGALHKLALKSILHGEGGSWEWLDRNNPASAFPTDFALLRISRTRIHNVLKELQQSEFVKDVSPQMRFTRSLTTERSEGSTGHGHEEFSSKNEELEDDGNGEPLEIVDAEIKPPGRLHTQMSFEGEVQASTRSVPLNASLENHGRVLLLQVTFFILAPLNQILH